MENKKHLYVIDGNSLLFRAYYATSYGGSETIMRTSAGIPTNAIFAFANMLSKILSSFQGGESLFVGFDSDSHTFRKEEYENYKANRKPAPEDLIPQFPIARELLDALGIVHYEEHGVEADDLCGTVARLGSENGYAVDVYTSDKDYLQLVDDKTTVNLLKTGLSNMNPITPEEMLKQFGFAPRQIIDYKGLCGDSSDNLPGIKGIGAKGATELIKTYGGFEEIIAAAKSGLIKGKTAEKIKEGETTGRLCYELATIKTDCPLPFDLPSLLYLGFEASKTEEFARKYELKTFSSRLPALLKKGGEEIALPPLSKISSLQGKELGSKIGLAFDLAGSNYREDDIYGFALSNGKEVCYIELEDAKKDGAFLSLLSNESIKKNVYDAKEAIVIARRLGCSLKGIAFDFHLACYLLNSSEASTPEKCLATLGSKLRGGKSDLFALGDPERCASLSCYLFLLEGKVKKNLQNLGESALYEDIEFPLGLVLEEMESEGFPCKKEVLLAMGKEYKEKMQEEEKEVIALAGHPFNVASPKQVAEVLYLELGLSHDKAMSTSAEKLSELALTSPICSHILAYRKYAKLLGTYIDGLLPHIKEDGKIHTCFNQTLTATGRLSSSSPNLQNIAARDEEGKAVRKAFYYDDGSYLLSLDYHQIELRILAELSSCSLYKEVFASKCDVHEETARRLFSVPSGEKVPSDLRRRAKAINFAIIYGTTPFGLAEQIGCSPKEASQVIDSFYLTYPEIKAYLDKTIETAQKKGYVETLLGRKRYLPELTDPSYMKREAAKRAALNAPVQGTAADLIKKAMLEVSSFLKNGGYKTRMVLQIHDELIFNGPKEELEELEGKLATLMSNALPLSVPLSVEMKIGRSWYELKE